MEGKGQRIKTESKKLEGFMWRGGEFDDAVEKKLKSMGDDRPLDVVTTVDGEDYAYQPPGTKEKYPYSRPGWRPGTYDDIMKNQSPGGTLICALCKRPIVLNTAGKEVWKSRGGRNHETRPPIDHDGPDWIERLAGIKKIVESEVTSGNPLSYFQVREMVLDAFHAPTLQIAHMKCNSGKVKGSFS